MAKKPPENVPVEKLRAIWAEASTDDWLHLFQELRPDHKWIRSGENIKGQCIYHADADPSMVVNLSRQLVHCFGCHRTVYSPIKFVADVGNLGHAAALTKLKNRFRVRLPAAYMQNLQLIEDRQQLKFALLRVMNDELVDAICNPDKPEYKYIRDAGLLEWLEERKLPTDVAHTWPVGVLPPQERMAARLEHIKRSDLVEKAYRYFTGGDYNYLAAPGAKHVHEGSLVFFYFTSPTAIGRLRLRRPGTKDFYAIADPYESRFGVFGLNTFPELLGKLESRPLICVEGEMDALAHIAHQTAQAYNDVCVVGLGGGMGAGAELDQYIDFGFREGWIGPDNDDDGVGFAREILSHNKKFKRVFSWTDEDTTKTVKDFDQAYRIYGFETFYQRLQNEDSFVRNYEWAVDMASRAVENIDSGDVRARTDAAAEYGAILRDESERNVYVEKMCSVYGLDKELIRQGMYSDEDDEDSFVDRLALKLQADEYFFLSERQQGSASVLMAWSKRKRVMRAFTLNSLNSLTATLTLDLGLPERYIQKEMGAPPFISYAMNSKGEPVKRDMIRQTQYVNTLFHKAVSSCVERALPVDRLRDVAAGVHYFPEARGTGEPVVFIVNGPNFFRGTFEDDDIKYEKLDCPVHGEYFFRLQNQPWSKDLLNLSDIEEGREMDVGKVFRSVRQVLDIGWRFQNHASTIDYLAADILYSVVATAFQLMILTSIGGESQSGKSTYMQVVGGRAFPDLKLCDAMVIQDDFSAASIRQAMTYSSLRLLLDEFEDSNFGSLRPERKARVVREIQDIFRSMSVGGTDSYRGTSEGEVRRFYLYFPAITGGIFSFKETRDINRWVTVRTKHISGFHNPAERIRRDLTYKDIRKLRRQITLCLLPRIPELIRTHRELQKEFAGNTSLQTGTDDRIKQNLLPAAAIMKVAGYDYRNFMQKFSAIKMDEMAAQGATQESTEIWNSVLHTPVSLNLHDPNMYGTATVAQMLGDPHYLGLLNGTDLGAYYIEDRKWLVVHWHKIISGVMRNDNKYRATQHPVRLKRYADEDPRAVPAAKLSKRFMQQHVWSRVGAKVTHNEISVLDVSSTIVHKQRGHGGSAENARQQLLDDVPDHNDDGREFLSEDKITRGNFE